MVRFFLGTHRPAWLCRTGVPLFVSRRTMPARRRFVAAGSWALDSGGFSELTMYGCWRTTPQQYADEVWSWQYGGGLKWAACQDWMCEPEIIHGGTIAGRRVPGTGLSVREHQELTTHNYLLLRELAPGLPWAPVLQGFEPAEYTTHVRIYEREGVKLERLPVVGMGSVCRRQHTGGILGVVRELHAAGIRLHAFGVKLTGLPDLAPYLESSDSLAWSFSARRNQPLPECRGVHQSCANCMMYALRWRDKVLRIPGVT